MTLGALCRSFFHIGVATLAGLVGKVLAEAGYFSAGSRFVTLGTVLKSFNMCLVIERNILFHCNHISCKCGSNKNRDCQYCNDHLFHVHVSLLSWFSAHSAVGLELEFPFRATTYHSKQGGSKHFVDRGEKNRIGQGSFITPNGGKTAHKQKG